MKQCLISLVLFLCPMLHAATVTFDGSQTYQVIEGFGVNANHRSWNNNELKPVLDALIDQAGMTLFRVVFDKTNWEASNDNSDPTLMNWTYYNSVYGSARFTPLWEMFAYLNSRGITNGAFFNFMGNGPSWLGGSPLRVGMEEEWAEMIVSLLMYARNTRGLQFHLVAPDNEPDLWAEGIQIPTASQYATALHELADLLDLHGLSDVRFMGPDLAGNSTTYMPAMMADEVVMAKLERFGAHSYSGGGSDSVYEYIQSSAYTNRPYWITEFNVWCSTCDSGTRGTYDWNYCRGTADYLLHHLESGASGGIVWEGYDSFYAHPPYTWSFWGLFSVDDEEATVKTYTPRKNFYTLAQISKFVRPGARSFRVNGSTAPFSPLLAFYQSDLGQISIVGINASSSAAVLSGSLASLPAVSYLEMYYTSATTNLADGGRVSVESGLFNANIPADCVFTLSGFTSVVTGSIARIGITPTNAVVAPGGTQRFIATATDGLGRRLDPQPAFSWSVNRGGGIDRTGLFAAGSLRGPFNVIARSSGIIGMATVNVASISGWTIWPSTEKPVRVDVGADNEVELGVKFQSDVTGTITGIRFYKSSANKGIHIGNLWASNGTKLATTIFSNESTFGWQQALFATPVTIASNTIYVASYHVNDGHYSADNNYFSVHGIDNPPLHALANCMANSNGVFIYGLRSSFPTRASSSAANYWVDVVFDSGAKCHDPMTNWYAGDMHVHRSCGGLPVSVSNIYTTMVNNDLAVVSLLADMGNGEVRNPTTDLPLVNGQDDPISTSGRIVHWDTEWHWDAVYTQYVHQALGGHVVALGLTNAYPIWQEYTYPIFDWAHQQGGMAGFVHMQYLREGFPQTLNCCLPIEYPVEVALGACDFISEDVNGSDTAIHAYYRLLNCGFRPGLAAGSDNPCGATIGSMLTYSRMAGALTYSNWIEGIAQGKTVVSRNGRKEFLDLKVNGSSMPGDEIQLLNGGSVEVAVQWTASQSLMGTIELVKNGDVVASKEALAAPGVSDSLNATVNFIQSGWLCARRMSSRGHELHTAAIFVTVDDAPVRASVSDAQFYVQWMDSLLANTSVGGIWSSYFVTNRAEAQARYSAARSLYEQIRVEALAQLPMAMETKALPNGVLHVAYSTMLSTLGGTSPYTWSIASGSLPAGLTLNSTNGAIAGMPTSVGTFSFIAEIRDAGSPIQVASNRFNIMITAVPMMSIWSNTATPVNEAVSDGNSLEVGVKFRSDANGTIHGIRFYKALANTNVHMGSLWTSNGTKLATATFSNETASGWQQVLFSTPVAIVSNTMYVASYHANYGHYSADTNYFAAHGVDNPPLHALTNGVFGGNGVYAYGASSVFPNLSYNAANYWVDVLFQPRLESIAVTPSPANILIGAGQQFTAMGTYSDESTQNITTQATWSSSNTGVATINTEGRATSVSVGTTIISATLAGVTNGSTLTVTSAPWIITIGNTNDETISDAIWSDGSWINASRFQAAVDLTVNTIFAKVTAISGKYKCAIYLDNYGQPRDLVCISAEVSSPSNGWQAFPLASPLALTNGHYYWLAIWSDDINARVYYSAHGGTLCWLRYDYGIWPDSITMDGSNSLNYCIFATGGTRLVPLIHWSMPSEIVYGTPLSAAHLNATSSVAGTLTYNPPAGVVLNAGMGQTLTATFTPHDTNMYVTAVTNVSINVRKKDLSITANSTNKVYGSPLPSFTASYSGFVNGDTVVSLDTPVSLSTTASVNSAVGDYEITAAGASALNYAITFVNGTLTITKAALIIIAEDASKVYGSPLPEFMAVYSGFIHGDDTGSLTLPPTFSTTATADSNVGTYAIIPSGAAAENYIIEYRSGVLHIVPVNTVGLLISSANPALQGTEVRFTCRLGAMAPGLGTPTGFVRFNVDGTNMGPAMALMDGAVMYTTGTLALGWHTVQAKYGGNLNFLGVTNRLVPDQLISISADLVITNFEESYLIRFGGIPGQTYRVEYTDNLLCPVWQILGICIANEMGVVEYLDYPPQSSRVRYYHSTYFPVKTIWPSSAMPELVDSGIDSSLELGVKFKSDVSGSIVGIRFYKAVANTGPHIGNLWTSNGMNLVTATFTNETTSGWQQVFFASPVAIASDTVYVASYHAPIGHYSFDSNYFTAKGLDNSPLHALSNGEFGGNGVYAYGSSCIFPNQTYNAANYWVDVIFQISVP